MKNLVIISWINFEKRINDLFCVDYLLNKGVHVEYWDVSTFTFYEHAINNVTPEKLVCRSIVSKNMFDDYVKGCPDDTVFACYMNYCPQSYSCYRSLSKKNATILYCINGCQPALGETKKELFARRLTNLNLHKIKQFTAAKLFNVVERTSLIKPVDYVLQTCEKATKMTVCKTGLNTKYVKYNSTNYQQVIFIQDKEVPETEPYMVFLDEYMPFHPYVKAYSGTDKITPEEYFNTINGYFTVIEKTYNCRVVIAAHPIAEKYKDRNYFDGRHIYFGLTRDLVKNSIGAITHNSTSINYAVIFKKPLVIIADRDTVSKSSARLCVAYAETLGATLLANKGDKLPGSLVVNDGKYDDFKYQYMTNRETENISNSDILLDILK